MGGGVVMGDERSVVLQELGRLLSGLDSPGMLIGTRVVILVFQLFVAWYPRENGLECLLLHLLYKKGCYT